MDLDGPITLATGAITITTSDNAINLEGTVDGGQALTLSSGTAKVTANGAIGSGTALTSLTVNSAGSGIIEITDIGTSSAAGVTGATAIGNTSTTTLTLDGTVYTTTGQQTYTAKSGQNIDITNTAGTTFTTTNTAVAFNTAGVDLANSATTTVDTGTGAGAVTFQGAIETNGSDDDVLTITSGTGAVTFSGAIGVTEELGGLNVNASSGSGVITFSSTIGDTSGGAGVIGTTAIGNAETSDLNFNAASYSFDGETTITAASGDTIDMGALAATSFTTAGDNITFATGNIELLNGSNLTVDTGAAGGNITIGEIAGHSVETVTLDAGTGTTSVGVIGTGTEIGALSIGSSDNGGIT